MTLDDLTLGELADAVNELRRLRERVQDLLVANTREVERRRRVEDAADRVLSVLAEWPTYLEADLSAALTELRGVIASCPICGAFGGLPCRTENVAAALPTPHPERAATPRAGRA